MKFVSVTYTKKPHFRRPEDWLLRIRAYLGILESLARKHTVVSIDRIDYCGDISLNNVQHDFPCYSGHRLLTAWKLNRHAANLKPDIVLVQGMIFPLEVILLKLQLGRAVKIIIQNHAEKPGRGRRGWLQRMADSYIDAYLFAAREMGDEWISKRIIRHPGKIREVMEASSDFKQMHRQDARIRTGAGGNPVFLWVGRLDANKNPLMVVRAFLAFTAAHPQARLYMIYHTEELLQDIEVLLDEKPDNRERVILIGQLPHDKMAEWYNASDFIVSGSYYEGSGVAVCEAMSCGCIPILTDILSFRKISGKGTAGILYTAGDEASLLAAFTRSMALDMAAQKEKVLEQFRSELSFDAIADGIYKVAVSL